MGYVLSDFKWGQAPLGRDGGRVTYSFDLSGLQTVSGTSLSDFEDAIHDAYRTWSSVADIEFEAVSSGGDIDAEVRSGTVGQIQLGQEGGVLAVASTSFMPRSGIDQALSAMVTFDIAETWGPTSADAGVDFRSVAIHEIGHTLGLGHPDEHGHDHDHDQIMNSFISTDQLQDGDLEGIKAIYGEKTWTEDGDDVFLELVAVGQMVRSLGGNDTVVGSSGDDTIYGGAGNDNIDGGDGRDMVIDGLGANTVDGGADADMIAGGFGRTTGSGGSGGDVLLGGLADDNLSGGSGADVVVGDATAGFFHGEDTLAGGAGNDFLEGGGGADVFVFAPSEGNDVIAELAVNATTPSATRATGADFTPGIDRVDLSAFDYGSSGEALSKLSFSGGHATFSDRGTTITFWDLAVDDLTAGDFIL